MNMKKDVYDKIVLYKDFKLDDITNMLDLAKKIFYNKKIQGFTFKKNYKNINYYKFIKNDLEKTFREEKDNMINYCNNNIDMSKEQIFEYHMTFGTGMYLNPMFSKRKALDIINQYNVPSVEVNLEGIVEFSKLIECDGVSTDTSPIIILKQYFNSTGFAVIDGNHRVNQAFKKGEKIIKAYLLDDTFEEDVTINPIFNKITDIYKILLYIIEYKLGLVEDMSNIDKLVLIYKQKYRIK